MTEQTYKATDAAKASMTLLVNPGDDSQRALWVVKVDRFDHQANAIRKARARHGDAPLAWMQPDGNLIAVA